MFRITKIKTFACQWVRSEISTKILLCTTQRLPYLLSFVREIPNERVEFRATERSLVNTFGGSIENYLWHRADEENWVMAIEIDVCVYWVLCVCVFFSIFACRLTRSFVRHSYRISVFHIGLLSCRSKSKTIRTRSAAAVLSHIPSNGYTWQWQRFVHKYFWLAIYLFIFILFRFADMQKWRVSRCQVQGRTTFLGSYLRHESICLDWKSSRGLKSSVSESHFHEMLRAWWGLSRVSLICFWSFMTVLFFC